LNAGHSRNVANENLWTVDAKRGICENLFKFLKGRFFLLYILLVSFAISRVAHFLGLFQTKLMDVTNCQFLNFVTLGYKDFFLNFQDIWEKINQPDENGKCQDDS
jgi:hypothetical protein